jgi:sulfide:quinone oxidoreductase
MYLSSDHWRRSGRLGQIDVQFFNAGAVLFGVADYVPALMEYVNRYDIALNFGFNLTAIDGPARRATLRRTLEGGVVESITREFNMIHVVPPQKAPDVISVSPLADKVGWVDVDPATLRHRIYSNVFALGDATNTPNAKTAAAVAPGPWVLDSTTTNVIQARDRIAFPCYRLSPLLLNQHHSDDLRGGHIERRGVLALRDVPRPLDQAVCEIRLV